MLLHLPRRNGHGELRVKKRLPVARLAPQGVRDAVAAERTALPEQLRPSLICDQGPEKAQRVQLRIDTEPRSLR